VPDSYEAVLDRLPPRLRRRAEESLTRWPGRVAMRTAATCVRVELFDRSMTIAAQFFTSVFPTLIVLSSWFGLETDQWGRAVSLPQEVRNAVEGFVEDPADTATFGILGTLFVLASATSLSRALARAFAAIWELPRPRMRVASAWRWVTVVLALALAVVTARALTRFLQDLPPPPLWQVTVSFALDVALGILVPWILVSGRVRTLQLLPGAVLFGFVMLLVRPASAAWLPETLQVSADRYGLIGVAFSYLAWLYVISFCFLASSILGHVVVADRAARPGTEP